MRMRDCIISRVTFCFAAILPLVFFQPALGQASGYRITDIATFAGPNSDAVGVNDSGQVVGMFQTGGGDLHAYLYNRRPNQFIDLGTLGGPNSRANGINASGMIVGRAEIAQDVCHAFIYDSSLHSITDLHSHVSFGGANSS